MVVLFKFLICNPKKNYQRADFRVSAKSANVKSFPCSTRLFALIPNRTKIGNNTASVRKGVTSVGILKNACLRDHLKVFSGHSNPEKYHNGKHITTMASANRLGFGPMEGKTCKNNSMGYNRIEFHITEEETGEDRTVRTGDNKRG